VFAGCEGSPSSECELVQMDGFVGGTGVDLGGCGCGVATYVLGELFVALVPDATSACLLLWFAVPLSLSCLGKGRVCCLYDSIRLYQNADWPAGCDIFLCVSMFQCF
jgi:hypothetical protein